MSPVRKNLASGPRHGVLLSSLLLPSSLVRSDCTHFRFIDFAFGVGVRYSVHILIPLFAL
jgi:hypothetical protein